jgi:hypothetical protein
LNTQINHTQKDEHSSMENEHHHQQQVEQSVQWRRDKVQELCEQYLEGKDRIISNIMNVRDKISLEELRFY